jgi:alkylation response protein AidB-like acyl-CoA dehydrogenase
VIRTDIGPAARQVGNGRYPRAAVRALGRTGILGLTVSDQVGGLGKGLRDAVHVVESVARVCPSTAAVLSQHYAATAVLEVCARRPLRAEIAAGRHLSTLAMADVGGGSDFWSCTGTAHVHNEVVDVRSRKRWVVSAGEADSYVWSTRPLDADGRMTLWLVSGAAPGLHVPAESHMVGLRGSGCADIVADPARIPRCARLGPDGAGQDIITETALPWYFALRAALCLGLVEGALDRTLAHLAHGRERTPRAHESADLGRIRLAADALRILLTDAVGAAVWDCDDTRRRLLAVHAAANEAVVDCTNIAMKACGETTFHQDCGIERRLRDALATRALEPTTDAVLDVFGSCLPRDGALATMTAG